MIDIFSRHTIKKELRKRNLNIDFFIKKCNSTQIFAKKFLCKNDRVILAKKQNGGIGRLERTFISKKGGVYFSLITFDKKENTLKYIPYIAVAVAEVLNNYGIKAKIKWPNDILAGGKKICGIICSSVECNGRKKIIIGVGINNKNDISEIENIANSIKKQGIEKKRAVVFADVVERFYQVRKMKFSEIQEQYKKRFVATEKEVSINQGEKILKGVVKGIDKDGFLLLQTESGEKTIFFGDVIEEL